jgi:hypothetical protein
VLDFVTVVTICEATAKMEITAFFFERGHFGELRSGVNGIVGLILRWDFGACEI